MLPTVQESSRITGTIIRVAIATESICSKQEELIVLSHNGRTGD